MLATDRALQTLKENVHTLTTRVKDGPYLNKIASPNTGPWRGYCSEYNQAITRLFGV